MNSDLSHLENEIVKCIRCGACQSACPVFRETGNESSVARGKVRLLRSALQGETPLNPELSERMSLCLMCKACTPVCPSGVKTDRLVAGARSAAVAHLGLSWRKRLVFRLGLKHRGIFRWGLKMGSLGRTLLFRPHPSGHGVLPRLPLGIGRRRLLQPLAPHSFADVWRKSKGFKTVPAPKTADARVALFTGCMVNYMYVDTGKAVVRVLRRNGVEVIYPEDPHCCGTPIRVNGDLETAVMMAKHNLDVLYRLDADFIVTPCASCGLALKQDYPELLKNTPEYAAKAEAVSGKTRDFAEYIITLPHWQQGLNPLAGVITYHDPCHLARGQGIRQEPRSLLQGIPGVSLVELSPIEQCCGSAGSFSLSHPDLSRRIGDRRIDSVEQSGAAAVVSGCSACLMQLRDGITRRSLKVETLHIAELLDRSYGTAAEQ